MKRGFHWIGQLPSCEFALLFADPVLSKVHMEVGIFPSRRAAELHCQKHSIPLLSAAKIALPASKSGARSPDGDPRPMQLANVIASKLNELYAENPGGIPATKVMEVFNVTYALALAAIMELVSSKRAKWERLGSSPAKRLFPVHAEIPEAFSKITRNQLLVLKAISNAVNGKQTAQFTTQGLSAASGLPVVALKFSLTGLMTLGYVERIETGWGDVPSTFKILERGREALDYLQEAQ